MDIPPFNLTRATAAVADPVTEAWRSLLDSAAFIGGAEVTAFEEAFAGYLGAAGVVGVANGTDALVVALRALDLGPDDEVIVPAFTFIATGSAVVLAGGKPVFADVDPETLNLDPASVEERIGERTAGVIGVHLFGRPFDVEAVGALCERHGLWLIEDAAQAHGARVGDAKVGTFGRLACWSFYPTKNLGAFGDAGAVSGDDPELLVRVRRVANHGRAEHYLHAEVGLNSRLDALQAAVLSRRLPRLDAANERRRQVACKYHGALDGAPGVDLPVDPEDSFCVYHQFTALVDDRDALRDHLGRAGIGTGVYYPIPLHRQPALEAHHDGRSLPVSEAAAQRAVSLPMFPEIDDAEVARVCEVVEEFLEARSPS